MSQLVEDRTEVREQRWRDDWPVAVVAAGAAALVWLVADLAGVDLAVRSGSGSQQIGLVSVVVTAVVVAMAGAGLLRLLERHAPQPLPVWTVLAGTVWVGSLVGPLGARSLSAGATLALMHVLVGAVVIAGLRHRHAQAVA